MPVKFGDAFGAKRAPLTVVVPPAVEAEMLLLPVMSCADVVSPLIDAIPAPPLAGRGGQLYEAKLHLFACLDNGQCTGARRFSVGDIKINKRELIQIH